MRVLMISKALVAGTSQRKLEELAKCPGVELTLVLAKRGIHCAICVKAGQDAAVIEVHLPRWCWDQKPPTLAVGLRVICDQHTNPPQPIALLRMRRYRPKNRRGSRRAAENDQELPSSDVESHGSGRWKIALAR